ncbi:minor tail protein [Gordonia phage Orchid]|uniref:Minor tail protein n=1 Tax=Gordonia phage Orchid TaxID=1838075 RepID=A0A160DH23_9CAUD|nr:minor tail protein [Gordonia phage Orchid]ANA87385.1 minor tail protein [Gordonia phage Orchid]
MRAYTPTIRADRAVDTAAPRAGLIVSAFNPTVLDAIAVNVAVPFSLVNIAARVPSIDTKRAVDIQPPRANVILTASTPTISADRKVNVDPIRASIVVRAYAPTIEINDRVNIDAPRSNVVITAYPPTVVAQRAVDVAVPRANVSIFAQAPAVIGGIGAFIDAPRAALNIVAYPPTVTIVSLVKQQINKVGRFSFSNSAAIPVTGWASDATNPAVLVSDSILDVVGNGVGTVKAFVRMGRNSTSGVPTARLVINGVTVDSVDVNPSSAQFGNTDPLRGRPCLLQWTGTLNAGDDIRLDGIRTVSTTGYVNDGSTITVEPGNTVKTIQRMYKNTSAFSCPNSRSLVTGWTLDAKYSGGSIVSDRLNTTLTGVGTARAYVVGTSNNSPAEVWLVMDGVDIGMITIPGSDQTGYWIEVPNVTFTGANVLSIETRRTNSASTRSLENDSIVVEALV